MVKELKRTPLISIVMSVYNGEKYLAEAIESILNQTYKKFEFIIVNDGSKDNSLKIVKEFIVKDKRIVLIDRENKGLPYSLNEGISIAKGEYIARMDADDISLPQRFERQILYIQENKLDICGSFIEKFDITAGMKKIVQYPVNDDEIKFALSFFTCLAHPTVMLKKEVFDKVLYNTKYKVAQDYQLWVDCAKQNFIFGNVPKVLLKYREHEEQAGIVKIKRQIEVSHEIMSDYADYLGSQEKVLIENIITSKHTINYEKFTIILNGVIKLSNTKNISEKMLFNILKTLYNFSSPKNPLIYYAYRKATKGIKKDMKEELNLFLKSLVMIDKTSSTYQFLKEIKSKYFH